MKKLVVLFVVLVGIGLVLLFTVSNFVEKGIVAGVEEYGPQITQSPVSLEEVSLSAFSGHGAIKGFELGNPKGFTTEHAIKVGSLIVNLDTATVLSDKIVINEILIDGPEINFESGLGSTNFGQILKNVESYLGEEEASEESADTESIRLEIGKIRITAAEVKVSNSLLGDNNLVVKLPEYEITDIGKSAEGATIGDVAKRLIASLNKETIAAIASSNQGIGQQVEGIREAVDQNVGGLLKGFKDSLESKE